MDIIEKLKNNWTAWGGLSEEERDFLRSHKTELFYFGENGWDYSVENSNSFSQRNVYRLRPDFEEKKEGRWVEYPIYYAIDYWSCNVKHYESRVSLHKLHELPSIVGFGGVQFEGQSVEDSWSHDLTCVLDGGWVYTQFRGGRKPATPVKARFWVND